MTRTDSLRRSLPLLLAWPAGTFASTGTEPATVLFGDTGALSLLGVAAIVAWHQLARRRELAQRWRGMHLRERWHELHLREQLRHAHLGSALAVALHLRRRR